MAGSSVLGRACWVESAGRVEGGGWRRGDGRGEGEGEGLRRELYVVGKHATSLVEVGEWGRGSVRRRRACRPRHPWSVHAPLLASP